MNSGPDGRHALIVATARYSDSKLQQLRAPAADAERLAGVLRDPAKGNFAVEVLIDESHATQTRRIVGFFRDRRPNDLLLLHFSCHGVKDDRGELYLAAADTELDLLSATGVSAAWLNDQISRTRSRRTVVLLDCCFSGSFPFGMRARAGGAVNAPEQFEGRGRAIITASSAMEYAYEGDELKGEGQPSVFTEAIVEGLETGRADLDHDQLVSVDDLYSYVYDRVKDRTPSQTPTKKSEIEGPLYIARSTYRPEVEPATLDRELLARTEDRYAGVRVGAAHELAELLASRDPAVALAARLALSQMTDDDSRQVSASAKAALAGAESKLSAPESSPRESAGREQVDSAIAGADHAGSTQGAETSSAPRPPPPTTATAGAPGNSRDPGGIASWIKHHWRLTTSVLVLLAAGAGAAAIILDTNDGDGSAGTAASRPTRALLQRLPDSIGADCKAEPATRDFIVSQGATEQADCSETPILNGTSGYLSYALFPSPTKARAWATHGKRIGKRCDPSLTAKTSDFYHGELRCEEKRGGMPHVGGEPDLVMWWNDKDSRVGGWLALPNHDGATALRLWEKAIAAP